MAIDKDIWGDPYYFKASSTFTTQSQKQTYEIQTSHTLWELRGTAAEPYSQKLDSSGVYRVAPIDKMTAGYMNRITFPEYDIDPEKCNMMTATCTPMNLEGNVNLRMFVAYGGGNLSSKYLCWNWAPEKDSSVNVTADTTVSAEEFYNKGVGVDIGYFNPINNNNDRNNTIIGFMSSSYTGNRQWRNLAQPLELDFKKMTLMPYFRMRTFKLTPVAVIGNRQWFDISNDSYSNVTWDTIKPEDNTPAGANYNEDIWEKGISLTDNGDGSYTCKMLIGVDCCAYYGNANGIFGNNWSGTLHRDRFGLEGSDSVPSTGGGFAVPSVVVEKKIEGIGLVYTTVPFITFSWSTSGGSTNGIPESPYLSKFLQTSNPGFMYNRVNQWMDVAGTGFICSPTTNTDAPSLYYFGQEFQSELNVPTTSTGGSLRYRIIGSDLVNIAVAGTSNANMSISARGIPLNLIWSTLACVGVTVCADAQTAQWCTPSSFTDACYIGETVDGVATGEMLQGTAAASAEQLKTDNVVGDVTPVDPDDEGGGGGDDEADDDPDKLGKKPDWDGNQMGMRSGYTDGFRMPANFFTLYALTGSAISDLGGKLWSGFGTEDFLENMWTAVFNTATLDFSECLKYFPLARMYPIDLSSHIYDNVIELHGNSMYFGRGTSPLILDSSFYRIKSPFIMIGSEEVDIPEADDWQDLEPYAAAKIYIPYCGIYDIPVNDCVGASVRVEMYLSLVTGELLAYVGRSTATRYDILFTASGNMGYDIPLVTDTSALKLGAMITSRGIPMLTAGAVGTAAIGMTAANAIGVGRSESSPETQGAQFDALLGSLGGTLRDVSTGSQMASRAITGIQDALGANVTGGVSGVSSPTMGGMLGVAGSGRVCVIIRRTNIVKSGKHSSTAGNPLQHSKTLSQCAGWTVCTNPKITGISATERELTEIQNLLASGIYA